MVDEFEAFTKWQKRANEIEEEGKKEKEVEKVEIKAENE